MGMKEIELNRQKTIVSNEILLKTTINALEFANLNMSCFADCENCPLNIKNHDWCSLSRIRKLLDEINKKSEDDE